MRRPVLPKLPSRNCASTIYFTQSGGYFGPTMRSLSRLKGILGLSHILITLGFLTSQITGSCTSQYHQKHELHISGNTVEQHDVYNTFSSILQIMLIAKQQMITMIDDQQNIVMSRSDCKLIGDGLSYRQIHQLNSSYRVSQRTLPTSFLGY